jgi:hypothetical protein
MGGPPRRGARAGLASMSVCFAKPRERIGSRKQGLPEPVVSAVLRQMQPPSRKLLTSLALISACSAPRVAAPPASTSQEGAETDSFDPAQEVEDQPFESVNGMRGPALAINGLRLIGAGGSVLLMISAYDEGSDIVLQFLPREQTPPDWLAGCSPSEEDPGQPHIEVTLQGVGDLSHNVLVQPDFGWSTSMSIEEYSRLETLRFEICGTTFVLEDSYRERLTEHARMARQRARGESTGVAAPAADRSR